ncbi:uncharacterized protein MELLADRAFT_78701 [Melampsora larici-populina 98AG31]|uniref:Chitin synthase activator n=1 Tax=Melampsora larici-populina (strain 98AG31 / pathotype 3-4-7) TaxID=747676 RepID=F4RXH5_MELLP|nr:uncharacterized protein MELLADRAFT_78701 [Melampsora larici-populina 98AG31]EGG02986.1 hypothetical protein MELLADRAFT_78701 [Melampsora larici-populina 98AG31]
MNTLSSSPSAPSPSASPKQEQEQEPEPEPEQEQEQQEQQQQTESDSSNPSLPLHESQPFPLLPEIDQNSSDHLFWSRKESSPTRALTRHSNRSSPSLRQTSPVKQAVPPLPTADDLHLDRLRLVDQSFTPPIRNQSQLEHEEKDSSNLNLEPQSNSRTNSFDLGSRSSQSIDFDTSSSRPSFSSSLNPPINQQSVASSSSSSASQHSTPHHSRQDSTNSRSSMPIKLTDSGENNKIIGMYEDRPISTSSLPVMNTSASNDSHRMAIHPAHFAPHTEVDDSIPSPSIQDDGYGGVISSPVSSHETINSTLNRLAPAPESSNDQQGHVTAPHPQQRLAGPGSINSYSASQPSTSGFNRNDVIGEPSTNVNNNLRPHYPPYPSHPMDPSQPYMPHQAQQIYANPNHPGAPPTHHPQQHPSHPQTNPSALVFSPHPAYTAVPGPHNLNHPSQQLRGVPTASANAFYAPNPAQRQYYQAVPVNQFGIAPQAQHPYPSGPNYSGPSGYADPYGHPQQALRPHPSSQVYAQGAGLSRSGTSMSSLSVSSRGPVRSSPAPPKPGPTITKASIDEYRNRIKSELDPEAHFNFAKFLIEAAKKLASGGAAGDDKAIKKYRDALLQESLKLIKKLATQGVGVGKPAYADAQFFLANCLGNGSLGLQVDHEKAYNLYVQASKQNHPAATYRTAVCNEVGAGTRKDPNRAVLFYRKASALGDTSGMYKLGMILLNGLLGQQRNPQEALLWLKRAAQQADEDNPHALHELAQIYEKPPIVSAPTPAPNAASTASRKDPTPVAPNAPVVYLLQRDEAYARELYTQASQLGYPPSQNRLGACYEYGALTCPVDPRRSIGWYTKAAAKGDAESELALSGWYLTGSEGVLKQSDSEAYLWARRAANKGLPKAEYAVGYYSEVGIGVKQNIDEAKRWYMRAATNNNKRAMQRLTELKKLGAQKPGKKQARPTRDQAASECIIS